MKKYFTLAAVATMFAACTSEELAPVVDAMTDKPVTVSGADITSATSTRGGYETGELKTGSLGLYFDTKDVEGDNYNATNRKVEYTDGVWKISGETPLLWSNGTTEVNYAACYPYVEGGNYTITLTADQTPADGSVLKASDFLYGYGTTTGAKSKDGIDITLYHQMSKLNVNVTMGNDLANATIESITINGCLASRTFTPVAGEAGTWSTEGTAETTVTMFATTANKAYECIILPQAAVEHIITLNVKLSDNTTKTYTYTLLSQAFELGKAYTLALTVSNVTPTIGSVIAAAWDETPLVSDYTFDEYTNTYTVYTPEGLKAVNTLLTNLSGKSNDEIAALMATNITLADDITLPAPSDPDTESNWTPIGTSFNHYTGTFNGGNHKIIGLTINSSEENQGLISTLSGAGKVDGVHLVNCNIKTSGKNVGGIVAGIGTMENVVTISNCSLSGNSHIESTYTAGNDCVGGIIGVTYQNDAASTISNCKISGSVNIKGLNISGGIIGGLNSASTLKDCSLEFTSSDKIEIIGANEVGLLVGECHFGNIQDCNVTNNGGTISVTTTGKVAGGIVGLFKNSVKNCHIYNNSGKFTVQCTSETAENCDVGGIAGKMQGTTTPQIINSSIKGCTIINSQASTGGIVGGSFSGIVSGCKAQDCTIEGNSRVGGIVGRCGDKGEIVIACYASNIDLKNTSSEKSLGGIVGLYSHQTAGANIIACYAYKCYSGGSTPLETTANIAGVNAYTHTDNVTYKNGTITDCYYYAYDASNEKVIAVRGTGSGVAADTENPVDWPVALGIMNKAIYTWNNTNAYACTYRWTEKVDDTTETTYSTAVLEVFTPSESDGQ